MKLYGEAGEICIGNTLAGIVVYIDVTALDVYVMAYVNVDSVGAWREHGRVGSQNVAIKITNVVALVDMRGPEMGILQRHVGDGYVA